MRDGDQGGEKKGDGRRKGGRVSPPSCGASSKEPPKIKLKIDIASKHPALACASINPPSVLPPLPLRPGLLLSCTNEHRKRLYVQSFLAETGHLRSFQTLIVAHRLSPPASERVWPMVIVIQKTNWPSFNSADKVEEEAHPP